ncbi:MAG: hypothetical protein D6758_11580 [Gammaproteobacteria bacterium]|nr:MAG: hypothetical protein D6758_11580 [Gammaproteobacteria bacterium]
MAKNTPALPPLYLAVIMFALGLFVATLIHTGTGVRKESDKAQADSDVLFELNGQAYRAEDLPEPQRDKWRAWRERARDWEKRLIESAALRLYFEETARTEGEDARTVSERMLAVQVSEDEVEAFYNKNRDRFNAPFGALRESIRRALTEHKRQQARDALIEQLSRQGTLTLHARSR